MPAASDISSVASTSGPQFAADDQSAASEGVVAIPTTTAIKAVRLTAGRVEKLVGSLERIAAILSSLGAETREVNKAIKILLKPTTPASQARKLNPSAYNLFIQRTMPTVRAEHPAASAKERMQLCAALWKKGKEEEAAAAADPQAT